MKGKRILSGFIAATMLLSSVPAVFAEETVTEGNSYFDFEASEYEVKENENELKIKIVRHGDGNEAADVAFKVADFLSDYGTDYEVLDKHGNPLEKVFGEKPDVSEFVYEGESDTASAVSEITREPAETADTTEELSQTEAVESDTDFAGADNSTSDSVITTDETEENTEAEDTEPETETAEDETDSAVNDDTAVEDAVKSDEQAAEETTALLQTEDEAASDEAQVFPENTQKKRKSTGSPLRDAQAEYLNLPDDTETENTEAAVKETLDDLYNYFLSAEGAQGSVHFGKGDKEQTITVKINDNDLAEQNKIFMIALMGTNTDNTTIAANSTTYVTIIDDEETENAYFDLIDEGLVLTSASPEGTVTIQRSGATQYFATVYVSTVKGTAAASAYEGFEEKAVAFVPGETEKKVKVSASDFSRDGKFGIRLEGESNVEIGNHYIDVEISSTENLEAAKETKNSDLTDDVSLMASNVNLGDSSYKYDVELPGGWMTKHSGEGKFWTDTKPASWLYLEQYDDEDYSMWVSNYKQTLAGVKNITFNSYIKNASEQQSKHDYRTYYETSSNQKFKDSLDGICVSGNSDLKEWTIGLGNTGDEAYIKFGSRVKSTGKHNVHVGLDWVRFNYAYYRFNPQDSAATFKRNIYDFTQGTPNVYNTYYDGETKHEYNPGGIVIKSGDNTVNGFYGGNTSKITITDANETKNKNKGIYLKGVYFAEKNQDAHSMYLNGKYRTDNVYYVEANNGKVVVTPNADFIKTLRDKSVISDVHADGEIKVFPDFAQEYVTVNFENSDRDDTNEESKGKFDEDHKCSYIVNILEGCAAGNLRKCLHDKWLDYYSMSVPKNSVIRVQTQPISSKVANGVTYWYHSTGVSKTVHYEAGEMKFSGTTEKKEEILLTDYKKADIVADGNMSIKPATGEQTFEVDYFPKQYIPTVYQEENKLTGAVLPSDSIGTDVVNGGVYKIKNACSGLYMLNESVGATGNVYQGKSTGNEQELWTIRTDDSGYYNLVNGSGYYLDVYEANSQDGTNVQTYGKNNTDAQDFRFEKQDDGSYAILTRVSDDKSGLAVTDSPPQDIMSLISGNFDNNIWQDRFIGNENQKWILECQSRPGADKEGRYVFENPFIGMNWSLTAFAPEGYYTQWVNMTGDVGDDEGGAPDGNLSKKEKQAIKGKSATMPDEVYGNKLSGQLDQDNFKLYYYFLPKTGDGNAKKTGTITRAAESFYQLANNTRSSDKPTPVAGAYVDIGGFVGMTDGNGDYSIECKDFPAAGDVSTTITADGSSSYYTISKLQSHTPIELPALSKFKAVSTDAYYSSSSKSGSVKDDFIVVEDDELTVTATVSSDSAIVPTRARFFIYDDNDNERLALEGKEGYSVAYETDRNKFTASLTFNPKKDMEWGYKLYVQFADQNDEWTNAIDMGYYFSSKISIAEFVFPLIGSSSLEDTIRTGFVADIIGDPLGDMDVGAISGFSDHTDKYTPSQINKDDAQEYTWTRTDYTFGWSHSFGDSKSTTSKKSDEEKLKNYLKSVYDGTSGGKEPPKPSKYSTKSKFKWSITPSVGFNLTLSSRKDKNVYFEDLVFYVKVDFDVSASQTIQIPLGMSILIEGGLSGDVAGIYHMYVDYQDSYETEDAVLYTAEDFGLFKKFTNSVRREGYIFLDPKIAVALGIGCGVAFVTGNASFDFDMDFQFTEIGTNTYGDVTIDLGWGIKVMGFTVYSKSLYDTTAKLFNSKGTTGHIDFDYASANSVALMTIEDYFSADSDEKLILDQPDSRDYLANRSEWLGGDEEVSLMSIDASEGTREGVLRNGTMDNPYVEMTKINDGEILMVFIDDDESRSNVNKRTLYYSIYNGTTWTEPVLVDDDGTADDYPSLCDLGDGRIFVAWSSAEDIMPDGATVEDALKSANIKAAFFDKQSKQMGEPMQITKTTEEDYAADVMPHAAYDEATGKMILYYTKTEYDNLENLTDLSDAYSVNAYMFYDDTTGKWSSADDYTPEELDGIANAETYKENWYGQRFLDLRLDVTSDEMPRVVDTSSINYNGLGLFAWTVDWDGSLDSVDDRDVFMQIYNFSENSFTHIIRVTTETSAYTTPKFERSNNQTYLFYGVKDAQSDHGAIKYLNVSSLIKNDKYTKIADAGSNEYYIFQYEHEAHTAEGSDGATVEVPAQTVIAEADTAAECDNPMDYDVKVSEDGQMYLFWTEMEDESRQITVSIYNSTDEDADEFADDGDETDQEGDEDSYSSDEYWSEPISITNANAKEYYSGLGAEVLDGKLIVTSAKGNYDDSSASKLVYQIHTPFAKLKATDVRIENEYPQPLSQVYLTATVTNEGLKTMQASETEPITVTFTMNGEVAGTGTIIKAIAGGASAEVVCSVTLPEDISDLEFSAYVDENETASTKLEQKSNVTLESSGIVRQASSGYEAEKVVYSGKIKNDGNIAANDITITAVTGETEIGNVSVDLLEANDAQDVEITLEIPDSAYTINEYGVGVAEISVTAASGEDTIATYSGKAEKVFSAEAIALLEKVTNVTFENNGIYAMKSLEEKDIQPVIVGDDSNGLTVQWLNSSNTNIAYIDYDNMIIADEAGTTTITGIVVPNEERIEFDSSGNSQKVDWETLIPEDKLIRVTATVEVSEATPTPTPKRSSGGGSSSSKAKATPTPAPTEEPATTPTEAPETTPLPDTTGDTPAADGSYFDDTLSHWAKEYIDALAADGIVNGTSNRIFEPDGTVTRAQFAQMLMKTGLVEAGDVEVTPFDDVAKNAWYYEAVNWAVSCGVAQGMGDGTFAPDALITREQMAAMANRFIALIDIATDIDAEISFTDADAISDWAKSDVEALAKMGIITGRDTGEFDPQADMTRAESAVVIYNLLNSNAEEETQNG